MKKDEKFSKCFTKPGQAALLLPGGEKRLRACNLRVKGKRR